MLIFYQSIGGGLVNIFMNKVIGLFLASQNISLFGSQLVSYAIIWYITLETSSGGWLTMITVCSMMPQALISLWGGVLADRYNKKTLIILSDTFIAIATLILVVAFISAFKNLYLILIVSMLRSIGAGVQTPAVTSFFPELVPENQLARVQGINQALGSAMMLLAPALGGLVLNQFGLVWTFIIDILSAAAAVMIMFRLKIEKKISKDQRSDILTDLKKGLTYTFHHRQLRQIMLAYALSFVLFTPAATLAPLLIERSFGNELWRLSFNQIIWGLGSIIGGLSLSFFGDVKQKARVISYLLITFGLLLILEGAVSNFWLYQILVGLTGILLPIIVTLQTVKIQQTANPKLLGRVFSIVQVITASAMPIAILFFGPLADIVRVQQILLITGAVLVIMGISYLKKIITMQR